MTAIDTTSKTVLGATPHEVYDLLMAALEVIGSVSPEVLKRCRADTAAGRPGTSPIVAFDRLAELADACDTFRPGIAQKVTETAQRQRQDAKRERNERIRARELARQAQNLEPDDGEWDEMEGR